MTTQRILNFLSLTIFGFVVFFIFSFVRACNTGIYQAGSGLGSIADIGDEK